MPLNEEQRIEIQESAKFLTLKRIREAKEEKEYKENLINRIAEARSAKTTKKDLPKSSVPLKGKEKAE